MNLSLDEYAEGATLLTGLENCIIGIVEEFGNGRRILYSKDRILDTLQKQGMTYEESEEYYDYNILGLHTGEQNAVFLDKEVVPGKINEEWIYRLK
jgi:hypothetical protein